jgi:predicted GNAT family acetyltransferase
MSQQEEPPSLSAGSSSSAESLAQPDSELPSRQPTSDVSGADAPQARTEPVVTDAPERHRFEIHVGSDLAGFTVYRVQGDRYAFTHTEIDSRFSGGGLASILVRDTLEEMRRRGISVLPYCPFVRRYISRHPQYLDLVPADARAEFDLPAA